MKIHTYYTDCIGHNPEDEFKLICLWREAWSAQGLEPVVLNEWQARQHPRFAEFNNHVSQLPTINSPAYERACFLRWLALAAVGGGLMADYDVFPVTPEAASIIAGSIPPTYDDLQERSTKDYLLMFQMRNVCPSLVFATEAVALRVCDLFMTSANGRRDMNGKSHVSDQYVLEDWVATSPDWLKQCDVVRDYQGTPDWDRFPCVHFNNGSMVPRGLSPRWKHIPDLLGNLRSNAGLEGNDGTG